MGIGLVQQSTRCSDSPSDLPLIHFQSTYILTLVVQPFLQLFCVNKDTPFSSYRRIIASMPCISAQLVRRKKIRIRPAVSILCQPVLPRPFPPLSATTCRWHGFYPGVKLQSILEFLHETLACESAIFMYKSEVESQRSPILRAFWRFEICRRLNTEGPCHGLHGDETEPAASNVSLFVTLPAPQKWGAIFF